MAEEPKIAIVGAGRLGSALAVELKRAGYTVTEIVSRSRAGSRRKAREIARLSGARATTLNHADLHADLIWICVPDREIAPTARDLAPTLSWKGRIVFHSSGALPSDELDVLRRRGASVASVHPLMTFVRGSVPSLRGVPFALQGDAAASRVAWRVVRSLGGQAFNIRK